MPSICPSTFLTSLGLIAPNATLTIAVLESGLGSGTSSRRRFETEPNSANCRARMVMLHRNLAKIIPRSIVHNDDRRCSLAPPLAAPVA